MAPFNAHNETASAKLLIVADDLTGAGDTGVQFSKRGLKTIIITGNDHIKSTLKNCDVLVVNTDSRPDPQEVAYNKAHEVGKIAKAENIKYFYKKIDSTMRGNIGAEISGLMDSLGISHTFMVPALPSYGRTTVNGKVLVNGIPVSDTGFARDPRNPVNESYIPGIISRQTDKSTALITLEDVRSGREAFVQKLRSVMAAGARIIIIDAGKNEDIDLIASVIAEIRETILFSGCSGLAEYLSKYLDFNKEKKSSVVIAGSVSEVTRKQIEFAADKMRVSLVDIETFKIFTGKKEEERKRVLELARKACLRGEDLIIRSAPNDEAISESVAKGKETGLGRSEVSGLIALFLGEIARDIIMETGIRGMLLTGGDTAINAAKCLNVSGIIIRDEILHSIPYGYFADEQYKDIIIVTKAGGFGSEDAIFQALNFLKNY
jgi:D-threonate/D-erythronate kinase